MRAMVRDLFAADSTFVFVHEVEPPGGGSKLKAEWTLGWFLSDASAL
jgi:hypothetical protein